HYSFLPLYFYAFEDLGGLVVKSRPRSWRVPGSKPDSTEKLTCKRAWCSLNSSRPNLHPLVWWGSLKRGAQAQASSSSSDLMPRNLLTCITKVLSNVCFTTISLHRGRLLMFSKTGQNKKLPVNYRPISLLSNLGKIIEIVILARLKEHYSDLQIILDEQCGFRPNHGRVHQLFRVTNLITQGFNNKF
ncbi:hypothetical protein AVEN_57726-1, partial [Araneus ventricosus]